MDLNYLEFKNFEEAWSGINEYLAKEEEEIYDKKGGIYGTELLSYNNFVRIRNSHLNPDFDFGTILGYHKKKWTSLIANYCDIDYLDLIKNEIRIREAKKAKSYNYSFHFSNTHGGGKDCLISLVFTKRVGHDKPIVLFKVRISEVTCRLPFDFLLVQRIIEYIYGKGKTCEVHFIAPAMYITAERFTLYNNYKSIVKLLKPYKGNYGRFQRRILKVLKEFKLPEAQNMKYKSFQRSAMQIQKNPDGTPLSGVKPLYAKELLLIDKEEFPKGVVSPKARQAHRRKLNKTKRARKNKK